MEEVLDKEKLNIPAPDKERSMTTELDPTPIPISKRDDNRTWQEKYNDWVTTEAGQAIKSEVIRLTFQLRRRGIDKYGMNGLLAACRYNKTLEAGKDSAGFKVNSCFGAYLARDIMSEFDELDGFFSIRMLKDTFKFEEE